MSPDERPAEERARGAAFSAMQREVARLAVDGFGATRHEDPVAGYQILTRTRIEPATAQLSAALHLQQLAARVVSDAVEDARAAGFSWHQIGLTFGLNPDGGSLGETAFGHVVDGDPLPSEKTSSWMRTDAFYFRCGTCDQYITDRGPYEANPENNESGHADSCDRFNTAVAEYREMRDDE